MKTRRFSRLSAFATAILMLAFIAAIIHQPSAAKQAKPSPTWVMNATIIEACSCPMFCQCYFNTKPAGHAGHGGPAMAEHFCRFNMGYKVNKGSYGDVKLDGAMFWIAGRMVSRALGDRSLRQSRYQLAEGCSRM